MKPKRTEEQIAIDNQTIKFLNMEFIEPQITEGWIAAHFNLMHYKNLSPRAKLLLLEIITLSKLYGYCFASNKDFAEKYGVSTRTIRRDLDQLTKNRFISREVDVCGHNKWKRTININVEAVKEVVSKSQQCESEVWTSVSTGMDKSVQIITIPNNPGGMDNSNSNIGMDIYVTTNNSVPVSNNSVIEETDSDESENYSAEYNYHES